MRTARRKGRRRVGRPRGPRPDRLRRRDDLLEAAARAIRTLGPGASMDDVAREAGLTKPVLYAHFEGKAGLAAALAERAAADVVPRVLKAFEQKSPGPEMVREAIDAFIGFVEAEPDLYRFLARGVAAHGRFVEQEFVVALGIRLAQVLRTSLRTAGADTGPAELWAFAILGAAFAAAEWWLARPTMSRPDLVGYLTDLVWRGISLAPAGARGQQTTY